MHVMQVTVLLDEVKLHRDVLHLFVTEGDDITIPLSATGLGHVVTCPAIADGVDFGPQFTGISIYMSGLPPQCNSSKSATICGFLAMHTGCMSGHNSVLLRVDESVCPCVFQVIVSAEKSQCRIRASILSAWPGPMQPLLHLRASKLRPRRTLARQKW